MAGIKKLVTATDTIQTQLATAPRVTKHIKHNSPLTARDAKHIKHNSPLTARYETRDIYNYKNIKRKRYRTNAAIWYNKICRQKQLTPPYINIRIKGKN